MKKEYAKPNLDTKAYAQFENVYAHCSKGNDEPRGCSSWIPRPRDGGIPDIYTQAAYNKNSSC